MTEWNRTKSMKYSEYMCDPQRGEVKTKIRDIFVCVCLWCMCMYLEWVGLGTVETLQEGINWIQCCY